jgi:hypothetical protein
VRFNALDIRTGALRSSRSKISKSFDEARPPQVVGLGGACVGVLPLAVVGAQGHVRLHGEVEEGDVNSLVYRYWVR